ncbi:hypothetical protein F5Y17DRAFT_452602 [Xylariaceae sp. FL0594]|nr:hypothetical protein F5Y17DRAFT_452602 [Xylariaceae sp. FL0594]
MTDQFIQYARLVAHEDHGYVEWRDILDDPVHRKWLCVGIFAQIIERKVFNSLLFGADPEIQAELDRHDSLWLLSEGFSRKEGRRAIARTALSGGLLPSNFWDSVDDLAAQTVLVFQPLFSLMCLATSQAPDKSGAMFLQEVHTILAMAGYFQICMSVSPSIFHVLSATPGARFQWDEETHADKEIYVQSKEYHGSLDARWRALADASTRSNARAVAALKCEVADPAELAACAHLPSTTAEYRQREHYRRRGGKVMYAVFPKLTRYRAENVGQTLIDPRGPTTNAEAGEGMRITIVKKTAVVYYQGLLYPSPDVAARAGADGDEDGGTSLESHLYDISLSRMRAHFLPYLRRSWKGDGSRRCDLHWPLWSRVTDRFWLWWLLSLFASLALRYLASSTFLSAYLPNPRPGNSGTSGGGNLVRDLLVQTLLYKHPMWFAVEAAIYLYARSRDATSSSFLLHGRGRYWKLQGVDIGLLVAAQLLIALGDRGFTPFSYLARPLAILDLALFGKLPQLLRQVGYFFGNEYTAGENNVAATAVRYASDAVGQLLGRANSSSLPSVVAA